MNAATLSIDGVAMDGLTTPTDPVRSIDAARFARSAPARRVVVVSEDEDAQLMLAYAGGEMRAFETLYARHRAALYRYLMRQARDNEVANDLFQEVWSRVVVNRARYEPRAKFRTFLFTLAHNCFIDHCRRVRTRPAGLGIEDADAADLLPADAELLPDRALERNEVSRCYRSALASLPAEQRDVYLLHEESGLSLEEIARVTGVGAETAKSRLRYAVNKLKAAMSVTEDLA
ncbi:MAG TPA: RNA polymerase sigma factor [Steroidobacteraceae bacterium]|nr:RNA polymerase sigma factor [Steroidobacteraceae bacterium]